jgi:hypothetical protein
MGAGGYRSVWYLKPVSNDHETDSEHDRQLNTVGAERYGEMSRA